MIDPLDVPPRVIAVDWSGAADRTARAKIWLAEVVAGAVVHI